jgi:hypothetical protein
LEGVELEPNVIGGSFLVVLPDPGTFIEAPAGVVSSAFAAAPKENVALEGGAGTSVLFPNENDLGAVVVELPKDDDPPNPET